MRVLGNTIRSGRNTPTVIVSDGIALKKDYCGFDYCNDGSFEIVPVTFVLRGMFLPERVVFLKGGKRKMFYGYGVTPIESVILCLWQR